MQRGITENITFVKLQIVAEIFRKIKCVFSAFSRKPSLGALDHLFKHGWVLKLI